MSIDVEFGTTLQSPSREDISCWADIALQERSNANVCIRIVDENEMTQLNHQFRDQSKPTNVLSFPADVPEEIAADVLGDIAICATIVVREADQQGKELNAHWAHMVIHGCLHLLGYDHIEDAEAKKMEMLEVDLLGQLGYPDPYQKTVEYSNHALEKSV